MRYSELNQKYYHVIYSELPIVTILKPSGDDYAKD